MEQNAPPVPVPPTTVEVSKGVFDLGTPKFNDVFRDNGQIIIDFAGMNINEVYVVHTVVNAEIKLHDPTLATKVKVAHKDIKKMKLEVQETEQKKNECEENYQKSSKAVALTCKNFAEEGITEEMAPDAKVAQLAEIVVDLRRKITKLEEKRRPNTPL